MKDFYMQNQRYTKKSELYYLLEYDAAQPDREQPTFWGPAVSLHSSTLKMKSKGSSRMLIPLYQTMWHHSTFSSNITMKKLVWSGKLSVLEKRGLSNTSSQKYEQMMMMLMMHLN
jgi:hypothetical protein